MRSCGLLTSNSPGTFTKMFENTCDVFIYEHTAHASFSSIKFTQIAMFAKVSECWELLRECTTHDHHDWCLPFLYGNKHLQHILETIKTKSSNNDRLKLVDDILGDKEIFDQNVAEDCSDYNEDLWSRRLSLSLKHGGIKSQCMAEFRGTNATTKGITDRIPKTSSIKCFVFRGAPDIIIEGESGQSKSNGDCLVSVDATAAMETADKERDDGGSYDSSASLITCTDDKNNEVERDDSGEIEMGFQMPPTKPYKPGSFISIKVGELIGAIHASLVAKVLQRCKDGKKLRKPW